MSAECRKCGWDLNPDFECYQCMYQSAKLEASRLSLLAEKQNETAKAENIANIQLIGGQQDRIAQLERELAEAYRVQGLVSDSLTAERSRSQKLVEALKKIDSASFKACRNCGDSSEYAYEIARDALAEWNKNDD